MPWDTLTPNEHGDWINQRNENFDNFISIVPDKKFSLSTQSFFIVNSLGLSSNRDTWVYNSSQALLLHNMSNMIEFFNSEVDRFKAAKAKGLKAKGFVNNNPTKISWSSSLLPQVARENYADFQPDEVVLAGYRPFYKQNLYRGDMMIHRLGQSRELFPNTSLENLAICVSPSSNDGLSLLISNVTPDLHFNGDTQAFPLYYYEKNQTSQLGLFDTATDNEYIRRDGVSDFIFNQAQKRYGKSVTKEDIFYYIYGLLHSPDYRITFANDLKKMLPRLPLLDDVKQFWAFSKAGRNLADIHINYETVAPYPQAQVTGADSNFYTVEKMRFPKKDGEVRGKKKTVDDTSTIIYNSRITITDIPAKAYEYVINGRSAIHWIMERYQVKTDKDSGITNNPNDWSNEVNNPRYILDLLLSIINVSVQTVDIVNGLPTVEEFKPADGSSDTQKAKK
jgi:predicted helicase